MNGSTALVVACLATSVVLGAGVPARAADSVTTTLTCPSAKPGYVFTYQVHWSRSGGTIAVNDVKVTDAGGGHWMRRMTVLVGQQDGAQVHDSATTPTWLVGGTRWARVRLSGGYHSAPRRDPLQVFVTLTGYTDAAGKAPTATCESRSAFRA